MRPGPARMCDGECGGDQPSRGGDVGLRLERAVPAPACATRRPIPCVGDELEQPGRKCLGMLCQRVSLTFTFHHRQRLLDQFRREVLLDKRTPLLDVPDPECHARRVRTDGGSSCRRGCRGRRRCRRCRRGCRGCGRRRDRARALRSRCLRGGRRRRWRCCSRTHRGRAGGRFRLCGGFLPGSGQGDLIGVRPEIDAEECPGDPGTNVRDVGGRCRSSACRRERGEANECEQTHYQETSERLGAMQLQRSPPSSSQHQSPATATGQRSRSARGTDAVRLGRRPALPQADACQYLG